MVFSKPLYFMWYIMVYNVLPQFFLVNVVHFNSTIMKDRNGSYDHLNFLHEKIGVNRRSLICQNHIRHKDRIRTKILAHLLAHCPIPAPGDFYKSTGKRTPKINEVYESHCLGTKNSDVWHGSLSQIRDETRLFADWLYEDSKGKKEKKMCLQLKVLVYVKATEFHVSGNTNFMSLKNRQGIQLSLTLKEPCLGLQNFFQCQ